jgi:hypothetical protein
LVVSDKYILLDVCDKYILLDVSDKYILLDVSDKYILSCFFKAVLCVEREHADGGAVG